MEQQSKGHAFSKITARNEATCSSRDSLRRKCCWVRNTSAVGDGDGWINMDPSYNGRHSRLRRTQPGSNASLDSYSQGVLPAAGPCCHVCQVGRTCLATLIRRSSRSCEPFFLFLVLSSIPTLLRSLRVRPLSSFSAQQSSTLCKDCPTRP